MIPAFRGEFGHKLRYHAPQVHALGVGHIIEIEPGDEALYPLAAEYRYAERASDDTRRQRPKHIGPERFFRPAPHIAQSIDPPDIVICPRMRQYGASKNWPRWAWLSLMLRGEGLSVFAAGAPDSSADVHCAKAWDYPRFLDASIQAMRAAKLCIATTAGLSLLAVLCGTPLLLITYRGLVAPGPQVDALRRVLQPSYGAVPFDRFYRPMVRFSGSWVNTVDAWDYPDAVIESALDMLAAPPRPPASHRPSIGVPC